jgi:hypothetical protein
MFYDFFVPNSGEDILREIKYSAIASMLFFVASVPAQQPVNPVIKCPECLKLYSTVLRSGKHQLEKAYKNGEDRIQIVDLYTQRFKKGFRELSTDVSTDSEDFFMQHGMIAMNSSLRAYSEKLGENGVPERTDYGFVIEKEQYSEPGNGDGRGNFFRPLDGKSTRQISFDYEVKKFRAPRLERGEYPEKEISRIMMETKYELQLNNKNKFSVVVPWSDADLKIRGASRAEDYSLSGARDITINHEMKTKIIDPKAAKSEGISWKFNMNLPTGKEQLDDNESRVATAIGETGEGFSKAYHGRGFGMGVTYGLDKKIGSRMHKYNLGYIVQGNYSGLENQISYKKPGDNIVLGYTRIEQPSKRKKLIWGVSNFWTMNSESSRQDVLGNEVVSKTPKKSEAKFTLNLVTEKTPKKLWETISFEYKERGETDLLDVDGFEKTQLGDRYYIKWKWKKALNKSVFFEYGIESAFGPANDILETTKAGKTTGKDDPTQMEEVQLVFKRMVGAQKDYKKWFLQGTLGLTDDSRDYTLSAGWNYSF